MRASCKLPSVQLQRIVAGRDVVLLCGGEPVILVNLTHLFIFRKSNFVFDKLHKVGIKTPPAVAPPQFCVNILAMFCNENRTSHQVAQPAGLHHQRERPAGTTTWCASCWRRAVSTTTPRPPRGATRAQTPDPSANPAELRRRGRAARGQAAAQEDEVDSQQQPAAPASSRSRWPSCVENSKAEKPIRASQDGHGHPGSRRQLDARARAPRTT